MAFKADPVAQQIQERLKSVHTLLHKIENSRTVSEFNLDNIEKIQEEINFEKELNSGEQRKLKFFYSKAVDDAKEEENIIRETLEKINEIKVIKNERRMEARMAGNKEAIRRGTLMKMLLVSAQTLPLYIGEFPGAEAPPLCGCVPAEPSYIAKVGDMVAAYVPGAEDEKNWILAEVLNYHHLTGKYEVDDIDEEEKKQHLVTKRRVIPLPTMRVNPETDAHALFPVGTIVLALFPQTTCFYKAVIHVQPSTAQEDYVVLFIDESYTDGLSTPLTVPQRYILNMKGNKKIFKAKRLAAK